MDRGPDFQESIDHLRRLVVPNKKFEEVELDHVVEELQQVSLITLVPFYSDIRLRFHPLLHAWAYDRQTHEEQRRNKAAALRLLTCVVDNSDGIDIEGELFPHARRFISEMDKFHVNDRAALVELSDPSTVLETQLSIWKEIYETVRAAYGDHDLRTSQALLGLAVLQADIPDFPKMEQLMREVLQVRRSVDGPRTALTAEAMYYLAYAQRLSKGSEESMGLLRTAYDIQVEILGPDHVQTQSTMVSLVDDLMDPWQGQPDYEEACAILEQLMDTQTRLYGPLHPWTLQTVEYLLDCYVDIGDRKKEQLDHLLRLCDENSTIDRAKDAYRELLEVNIRLYGKLSSRTLSIVLTLAKLLQRMNRNTELETLLKQYARNDDELHGEGQHHLVNILVMLGSCLISQSRYAEAQAFISASFRRITERYGKTSIFTVPIRDLLASCHSDQKHYAEAESLHRDNIKCFEEIRPQGSPGQLLSLKGVARCVYEQNRFEESEELWRGVYLGEKVELGQNHPKVCISLCWMIKCMQKRGIYDAAALYVTEAMQIYRALEGRDKGEILEAYWRVAEMLERQKMFNEAEEVFRAHIDRVKEFHGDNGRHYATEEGRLARFLYDRGRYEESKVIRKSQLRRWTELQDRKWEEFITDKLQQIEAALRAATLDRPVAIVSLLVYPEFTLIT
ncbi:hypothetical protein PIIN_10570 [Serendipita indica DSM 11827]|uniref:Kinesin light chain n=1 Tax=Serendipita indica (strain DSM 11827) TaxID=1109443 RepID=G4TZ35_SERID|nr:hypothetical protein PIIN_10570 [Serendipita indica DSM 11827]